MDGYLKRGYYMANYIYSTLTAPQIYIQYAPGNGNVRVSQKRILIHGGANLARPSGNFESRLGVSTSRGEVTEVSDEDLLLLEKNLCFKNHVKDGFITVRREEHKEIENAVKDMAAKDKSAPKTPEDYLHLPEEKRPYTGSINERKSKK